MNHNSFPGGEQAPTQQDGRNTTSFLSFEELRQAQEANARELMKPSMKNAEDGMIYMYPSAEGMSRKIKNGEKLEMGDIVSFSSELSLNVGGEAAAKFLEDAGIGSGKNFDMKLPAVITNADGSVERTSLDISFENDDGDFTRIGIGKNEDGSTYITSWKGKREFTDVGYNGPVPAKTIDGDETRDHKSITVER